MNRLANDFLKDSIRMLDQRGKDYDTANVEISGGERSMGKAVEAFNIITNNDISESEGWLLLQILKDVRQWTKPAYHEDSAIDSLSYCALKCEALEDEALEDEDVIKNQKIKTKEEFLEALKLEKDLVDSDTLYAKFLEQLKRNDVIIPKEPVMPP